MLDEPHKQTPYKSRFRVSVSLILCDTYVHVDFLSSNGREGGGAAEQVHESDSEHGVRQTF